MIKIAIIDDEPLVRMGMKSIIEWEQYGYLIIGEAGNGIQGLELIMETRPDVVLLDLMMPKMDGIEMMTNAREKGFKGRFIILTCVSEFEYLQKAIRLGVSRYILKNSVSPEEILETVNEITEEIQRKKICSADFPEGYEQGESFVLHEFMNLVFKGVVQDSEEIGKKLKVFGFPENRNYFLHIYTRKTDSNDPAGIMYKVASLGKNTIDEEESPGTCFINYENYLVILSTGLSAQSPIDISYRLKESAHQYFDLDLVGEFSKIDTTTWNINFVYRQLKEMLSQGFFGREQKTDVTDWISRTEYASYNKLETSINILHGMMLHSQTLTVEEAKKIYVGAVDYTMKLFQLTDEDLKGLQKQKNITLLEEVKRIASFEEMHQYVKEILKECYALAERKGYPGYDDSLVDEMIHFICDHCKEKISTKDVAEHIHFSVDYTCRYFKKKTQTNLTDYILRLKIYRSREELMNGMSLANIAEEYGFSSDGHYSRVFKKYEGITPGAFVRKNKSSKIYNIE